MTVVFRTDSSRQIGTGHVMRCITLAKALKEKSIAVLFISRDHDGNLLDFIRNQGIPCKALPGADPGSDRTGGRTSSYEDWLGVDWRTDATDTIEALNHEKVDWIVVDHYAIDYRWEQAVRTCARNVMIIDDLKNRGHDADLLLDQTYGRPQQAYSDYVPASCQQLMGTGYALLRPEFSELRSKSLAKREKPVLQHMLISLGGVDQDNITCKVLKALRHAPFDSSFKTTIVMGSSAPWITEVEESAAELPWPSRVKVDVRDMAELMLANDFAIGGAGVTTWERCCLGLPSILIPTAANQADTVCALESENIIVRLEKEDIDCGLSDALTSLMDRHKHMINESFNVCDGLGLYRTLQHFEPMTDKDGCNIILRPARESDIDLVYEWQKIPEVRAYARNPDVPDFEQHKKWMTKKLRCRDCYFHIIQKQRADAGCIRLDRIGDNNYEISIYITPEVFGRGVASLALTRLKSIHPTINILATVLPDNTASQKLFLANGFVQTGAETFFLEGRNRHEQDN